MFTAAEYGYLRSHRLGRLASIGLDGAPQVHPVPFVVDRVSGCIEIEGPRLHETQKSRNIRRDPRVSLVVDDQACGLEIRGAAELADNTDVIRVKPVLIIAWNIDGPGCSSRFVS
jgi:pyridoxamine 5'-phosphate oxidase family protein